MVSSMTMYYFFLIAERHLVRETWFKLKIVFGWFLLSEFDDTNFECFSSLHSAEEQTDSPHNSHADSLSYAVHSPRPREGTKNISAQKNFHKNFVKASSFRQEKPAIRCPTKKNTTVLSAQLMKSFWKKLIIFLTKFSINIYYMWDVITV